VTYVRSMKGWWLKNPVYLKYMVREATSVFVTLYALVLLNGLWCLAEGEAAYMDWQARMSNPIYILFHLTAIAASGYHAFTWFKVAPKVVPHIYLGTSRIPDVIITRVQYAIAIVCYSALLILVWQV
jgi:succinate dehydrogenase subunit C